MGPNLQDFHNHGQTDESEGVYNPPSTPTIIDEIFDHSGNNEDRVAEREAYDAGWNNSRNQR